MSGGFRDPQSEGRVLTPANGAAVVERQGDEAGLSNLETGRDLLGEEQCVFLRRERPRGENHEYEGK